MKPSSSSGHPTRSYGESLFDSLNNSCSTRLSKATAGKRPITLTLLQVSPRPESCSDCDDRLPSLKLPLKNRLVQVARISVS